MLRSKKLNASIRVKLYDIIGWDTILFTLNMWVKSQNCPFFSCHRNKIKCSRENLLVTLWLKQFIVVRIYQTNNRGKDPSISKILSSIHQSVYPALVKPLHGKSFSIIGKMQWKERLLLRTHFISITNIQWSKLGLLSWRTNYNQLPPLYLMIVACGKIYHRFSKWPCSVF